MEEIFGVKKRKKSLKISTFRNLKNKRRKKKREEKKTYVKCIVEIYFCWNRGEKCKKKKITCDPFEVVCEKKTRFEMEQVGNHRQTLWKNEMKTSEKFVNKSLFIYYVTSILREKGWKARWVESLVGRMKKVASGNNLIEMSGENFSWRFVHQ